MAVEFEDTNGAVPNGTFTGFRKQSPAFAKYTEPYIHKSNFGTLRAETNPEFSDAIQMRALGFVEGYLTAPRIMDYWYNMQWWLGTQTNDTRKLTYWLHQQDDWTRQQLAARKAAREAGATAGGAAAAAGAAGAGNGNDSAVFWDAMGLVMEQVDGLVQGYNAYVSDQGAAPSMQHLTLQDILLLNAFGDIDDLVAMMDLDFVVDGEQQQQQEEEKEEEQAQGSASATGSGASGAVSGASKRRPFRLHPRWQGLSPSQLRAKIAKSGRCSAIIKVKSDFSDILMGHTTWWSYSSLLRVYKHYTTHLSHPAIKCQRHSFSSYPAMVTSMDDWYVLGSGLVVTETSNDVYDSELYRLSSNQAALSWHRTRIANMLPGSGAEWAHWVKQYNSGTYNNQYMIVDLKRFTPGEELQAGLLTVVEIVPGLAVSADMTDELVRGYWPSYNVPYFPEIYNITGYPGMVSHLKAQGVAYSGVVSGLSYQLAPRAKLFRRDHGNAHDLDGLKRLLRSNGFPHDPYTTSPWDAVCARGDLDPEDPDAYGCYDGKVTNYGLAMNMRSEAINGPTYDGDAANGQPAFTWAKWKDVAHRGMIEKYKVEWEVMAP